MPKPNKGESQEEFVGRCIPQLVKEGKSQAQSIAICMDIYRRKK